MDQLSCNNNRFIVQTVIVITLSPECIELLFYRRPDDLLGNSCVKMFFSLLSIIIIH